jgi:hypothetical protein
MQSQADAPHLGKLQARGWDGERHLSPSSRSARLRFEHPVTGFGLTSTASEEYQCTPRAVTSDGALTFFAQLLPPLGILIGIRIFWIGADEPGDARAAPRGLEGHEFEDPPQPHR